MVGRSDILGTNGNAFPLSGEGVERQTRQAAAVQSVLQASAVALTPAEIRTRAQRAAPRLSLSTVYRQLHDLVDAGAAARVDLPGRPTHFEASRAPAARRPTAAGVHRHHHHHHFHCNACDRIYPIDACPGPMKDLVPKGFRVEGHEITLHGRCPRCARPAAAHP